MDDSQLTRLFARIEQGDDVAITELMPLVYGELRHLAAAKMARERSAQTLQPTALVHEAWLRLGGDGQPQWKNRGHFFSAAAEAMRRILIDNARHKQAARRGGGVEHIDLDQTGLELSADVSDNEELLLLNDALELLAESDPRRATMVKQRYFAGMTFEEIAEVSDVSTRTVKRDWTYARAWLFDKMEQLRRDER